MLDYDSAQLKAKLAKTRLVAATIECLMPLLLDPGPRGIIMTKNKP
jgi:hypothetical protein